ncbi:hypothetical protein A3D01_01375 [Candidatus Woesebacteria bacterium RIFCSPHIGHO2_02_FULL_39_13]|uniref:Uncharacterized protein n=1 Tax=Candidatus Woesebacteria bacterium RIFCSPHIGHO2_02_FULL_39_13 TaxID=1802505 RepID=A0A1F7Z3R8_9BACT|nr:MAG: hypothetical protein A3D01_01375 [Candidatus Woesebacteria bacterium RIFCSPHIGHO2_02_FULL_39_13]
MRKEKRKKEIKLRKNFFVTLLVIITLWIFVATTILFVDPSDFGAVPLFFLLIFLSLFFTISTILIHTRGGLIIASTVTIFLALRYLGVGNILNLVLLAALAATIEVYFSKKG